MVLTPLSGIFADRWGRKPILVPPLLLFALAGSGCAFAGTYRTLLALSFFQGVGAAAPGSLNATLIGGVLAAVGWNYPFFLPVLVLPVDLKPVKIFCICF